MSYFTIYFIYLFVVYLSMIGWYAYKGDLKVNCEKDLDEDQWNLLWGMFLGVLLIFPLFMVSASWAGEKLSVYLKSRKDKKEKEKNG